LAAAPFKSHAAPSEKEIARMNVLLIILIVIVVLALLGFFGRGRF